MISFATPSGLFAFLALESFEPNDLPRFRRAIDSFLIALLSIGILMRAGAFSAGMCDFVTFFVSVDASRN